MKRVIILHNQIAPYRLPLFEALANTFALKLLFCYDRSRDRLWNSRIDGQKIDGKVIRNYSMGFRHKRIYFNPGILHELAAWKPDVTVLTNNPETMLTTALAYAYLRIARRPFVTWQAHHMHRRYRPKGLAETILYRIAGAVEKLLLRHARAVIAYGELTRKFVVQKLKKPSDHVFSGTQIATTIPGPIPRDFSAKPLQLLYLGYLVRGKRVDDLVHAFRTLVNLDAKLTIAGDGPERSHIKGLAKGDDRIRFVGYVEGDRKDQVLRDAHVFVTPSEHDNMPNSLIEAMSYGLPVIATRESYCPEWLQENALVFSAGDGKALCRHLRHVSRYRDDLESMGKRSRQLAMQYSIPYAVKAFEKAINLAINDGLH